MRFGQAYSPRCFKIVPKMIRSNVSLRLALVMVMALFFILTYVLFTSRQPLTLPPSKLLNTNTPLGLGSSALGNTRKENWDKQIESESLVSVQDAGDFELHISNADEKEITTEGNVSVDETRESDNDVLKTKLSKNNDVPGVSGAAQHVGTGNNQTGHRPYATVPIQCDPAEPVSEILRLPPIKYLPQYKNPCWHERLHKPIEDLYINNGFAKYSSSYEKALEAVREKWAEQRPRPAYRLRCLPYFLLAGQPKCGSTDFYRKIVSHPDVVTPPTKESHWWGKNRYGWCLNYTTTIPFSDYVDLYDGAAMEIESVVDDTDIEGKAFHPVITGDASVSTLWANDDWWMNPENCGRTEPWFTNAQHVHMVLPQARIIVILRNPTDRLYSDFLFFQRSSKSQEYFHNEVEAAVNSLKACILDEGIRACVYNYSIASKSRVRLRLGLYQVYLKEWMSLFPREQMMVVRLEDYSASPLRVMKRVHKFLDLRTLSSEEEEEMLGQPIWNTRRESDRKLGKMLPKTRALLDDFYGPYNAKLAKLLRDDKFLWKD